MNFAWNSEIRIIEYTASWKLMVLLSYPSQSKKNLLNIQIKQYRKIE